MIEPYTLTAIDLAAIAQADSLCVFWRGSNDNTIVRASKKVERTAKTPFAEDVDYLIPAPVIARGFGEGAPTSCSSIMSLYPSQYCERSSLFSLLRPGDRVRFDFCPDHHANGYMARARLHGDCLILRVWRSKGKGKGEREMEFTLDSQCCPENSARMCKNAARSSYNREQEKAGIDW